MRYDEPRRICGIWTNDNDCVPNAGSRVPTLRHQALIILRLEKGLHQPLTPLTTRSKFSIVLLTFNICRNDSEITLLSLRCTVRGRRRCNTCE